MRVLFLTHNFPRFPGDVSGSFLLRLATALADERVEVRVVAPAAAGYPPNDRLDGIDVRRFRYAPRALETIAYTGNMAADVTQSWTARAALAGMLVAGARATRDERVRWSPDVVHAHWWFPNGLAATVPGALGSLPLVVTSHGSDVRLAANVAGARPLLARVARRAAAFTFVSRWLLDEARALAPIASADVAPMPVDTSRFAPGEDVRRGLLFVGRLNAQKGLAELLRATAALRVSTPLTVVGDGPDAASLRALAAQLGVGDRVTWLPPRSQAELAALYRAAVALVVPSTGEGLGLVAVESQLCATPVVAFASGGLTDVVTDGRNGLLVPPGDVASLAAALDALLASPARAATMGANGREDAIERFSPSAVARRYAAIYATATGARS